MTRYSSSNNRRRSSASRQDSPSRRHVGTQYMPRDDKSRVAATIHTGAYDRSDRGRRQSSSTRDARDARRVSRQDRKRVRSIGADVLSLPASRALGLGQTTHRSRNRSQTTRRPRDYSDVTDTRQAEVTARPAVYTQKAKTRTFDFALPSFAGRLPLVLAVLVVVAALVFGVLWGPARAYYLAWRESGVLQVEYEVLAQQNADLDHDLDRLQSLEGIEDEARRRGYVYPGEEALVVSGVEEQKVADPSAVQEAIDRYEESQPWYVGWLDTVFGYQRGNE